MVRSLCSRCSEIRTMVLVPTPARAQFSMLPADDLPTVFPHPAESPLWLSGQTNVIFQWHPEFHAQYSGPNSLHADAENATSYVLTLFAGYQVTETTEVLLDGEATGGRGLSNALGLAGFTNLDVVRNPDLGKDPYIARAMIRQIIPLSDERVPEARGPLALAASVPARRIEVRIGKMGVVDFFDVNPVDSCGFRKFCPVFSGNFVRFGSRDHRLILDRASQARASGGCGRKGRRGRASVRARRCGRRSLRQDQGRAAPRPTRQRRLVGGEHHGAFLRWRSLTTWNSTLAASGP